jgi:GDP-4-dehydro-6-deoxy-D-mannose reductase
MTAMASAAPSYRRILFTGATGFVGHYLAPAIAGAFPDVRRLILRRHGDAVLREGWQVIDADLLDGRAIDAAIAAFQPDLVLHLAAQSSVGASVGAAEATWRINFCGALNLASACSRHAPSATFFFVSSSEVYGRSFRDGPSREDTPLRPVSAYAKSKAAAESMLPDVLTPQGRLIVVRPFNHTGPLQDERFVLPSFAAQIAAIEADHKSPILEVGNLEAARDFLDVRDVCAAYIALLRKGPDLPPRSVFNVGSGKAHSIRTLLDIMVSQSSRKFEILIDPMRLRGSDIPVAVGESDKLAAATGWTAKIPLRETLRALLDYWRQVESLRRPDGALE